MKMLTMNALHSELRSKIPLRAPDLKPPLLVHLLYKACLVWYMIQALRLTTPFSCKKMERTATFLMQRISTGFACSAYEDVRFQNDPLHPHQKRIHLTNFFLMKIVQTRHLSLDHPVQLVVSTPQPHVLNLFFHQQLASQSSNLLPTMHYL